MLCKNIILDKFKYSILFYNKLTKKNNTINKKYKNHKN